MNFINFESVRDKERAREDLRNAREELLKKAKENAEKRIECETERKLRGDETWILPSIERKLKKTTKNEKKSKKKTKHKREKSCSDTSGRKNKKKKNSKKRYSSSSNSEQNDEWVEKVKPEPEETQTTTVREDWMTGGFMLKTYSKNIDNKNENEKQNIDAYDPKKSSRELNPYWKDGGSGLPIFQKPNEDDDSRSTHIHYGDKKYGSGSWRKSTAHLNDSKSKESIKVNDKISNSYHMKEIDFHDKRRELLNSSSSEIDSEGSESHKALTSSFMTDQQMNELGAKMIKAEILGNEELAKSLKDKLENARIMRDQIRQDKKQQFVKSSTAISDRKNRKYEEEHVLLTRTDNKGVTRPLSKRNIKPTDHWGGRKCKSKKVETHTAGERVRYFADDDRYDIKQMFEREKYASGIDSDLQFAEIAGKNKNPNDDLDDIFEDKVRKNISESAEAKKEQERAIQEHEKLTKMLDNCNKCFDSVKMEKQLMVSMGSTVYLSLPWHEGLQVGHCLIIPIQHVSCSTQLDEDTWEEINNYRKALTRMFAAKKQDVIFFETARYLHRRPHMAIHCIASNSFEEAPFYFKKAIQESEYEWSTNNQLISLEKKDLRRSIPKGLPYFWINFGMDSGFAHVIEDQERFPSNFAQEIIGGILHLDSKMWRKPRKEYNSIQKVKQMADWWKPYDFTE